MKTIFSILGLFVFFVFFLSMEANNKTLFSHIYGLISPVTKSVQSTAGKLLTKSLEGTQKYSQKIFDNSVPKIKDSVKSKLSSQKRIGSEPAEKITPEEKEELDQLIKNH